MRRIVDPLRAMGAELDTEADGTPQELADSPPFPNGSSGYHRVAAVPWSRSAQA